MRKMRVVARFLSLTLLVCLFSVALCAQQQGELGMDCKGEVSRQPPGVNLSCRGWKIKLFSGSTGKEWGMISSKTRDGALRELQSARRWWRDDAHGYQELWASPSDPICDMCDPANQNQSKAGWADFCKRPSIGDLANARKSYLCTGALREIEDWGGRVFGAALPVIQASQHSNPFGDVFKVALPYVSAIGDAMKRVTDLRRKLEVATDWTEIATALDELRADGATLDREYNRLPSNVRAWLEGRYSPALDGVWVSQERGAMRIAQTGDNLRIYDGASGQLMWSATRDGGVYLIPAARRPYGIANASECGLSSNMVYTNVAYRVTVSDDGRSITIEEITNRFTVGTCEVGGVFTLGTWYKK